jgi:hypothetical protein
MVLLLFEEPGPQKISLSASDLRGLILFKLHEKDRCAEGEASGDKYNILHLFVVCFKVNAKPCHEQPGEQKEKGRIEF